MADGKTGAPFGNQNATKAKVWSLAINRALEQRSRADRIGTLNDLAEKLIDCAMSGDLQALKEIGDRLEGKPAQAIVGEANSDPVQIVITATQAKL